MGFQRIRPSPRGPLEDLKCLVCRKYYALMMDKNDRVFAQKCKGRPTSKQVEEIKIHGELKSELCQLRKDFSMKNHSEISLFLSIAADEMQRAVSTHVPRGVLHGCHYLF